MLSKSQKHVCFIFQHKCVGWPAMLDIPLQWSLHIVCVTNLVWTTAIDAVIVRLQRYLPLLFCRAVACPPRLRPACLFAIHRHPTCLHHRQCHSASLRATHRLLHQPHLSLRVHLQQLVLRHPSQHSKSRRLRLQMTRLPVSETERD